MKKHLSLSIKNPCAENWQDFTSVDRGSFCNSCQKTVVDFTNKSDAEVFSYFNLTEKTCGRFRIDQLNIPVKLSQ